MELLVRALLLQRSSLSSPIVTLRLSSTKAALVALCCTLFNATDIPVYWPILVIYFCILFALTMRRQIQYVCWSIFSHFASNSTLKTHDQIQVHSVRLRQEGAVWVTMKSLQLYWMLDVFGAWRRRAFYAIYPKYASTLYHECFCFHF